MAIKYKDFILEYYKRMTFRDMPWPQFLQFCDDVKKDNLSDNQKLWRDDFLARDAGGNLLTNPIGGYIRKDDPDPYTDWKLTDTEWENMYRAFRTAFRGLKANESNFSRNTNLVNFVNRYYVSGAAPTGSQAFDPIKVKASAKSQIDTLKSILTNPEIGKEVITNLFNAGKIDKPQEIPAIISGITNGKYEKDDEFRNKLIRIAAHIDGLVSDPTNKLGAKIDEKFPSLDLSDIYTDFEDPVIDRICLTNFKGIYPTLLQELYKNNAFRTEFEKHDTENIVKQINSAKSYVNYNDAKGNPDDYIAPKPYDKNNDTRNVVQRISEWWSNTNEGYLEKYTKLQGDRMFFSDQAKEIVRAFDKSEPPLKPTDGLAKIVEACDKIAPKLKLRQSKKHLKWFQENMTEIASIMPKSFKGALQHGTQMRAIVSELIRRAVEQHKTEEAKTAMEILSVMKYGLTTSKFMDAMKGQHFTIFGDKNLSWNKNSEMMSWLSNSFDRLLEFGVKGVFRAIQITKNAIFLSGSKFNGDRGNILRQQQERDKAAKQAENTEYETNANAEINRQQQILSNSKIANDADLSVREADRANKQQEINNKDTEIKNKHNQITRKKRQINMFQSNIDAERNKPDFQHAQELDNEINNLAEQENQIDADIAFIDTELAKPQYQSNPMAPDIQELFNAFTRAKARCLIDKNKLNQIKSKTQTERTALQPAVDAINQEIDKFQQFKDAAENRVQNYESEYKKLCQDMENLESTRNDLDSKISQYKSASDIINELNRQKNNRDTEMQNWDNKHMNDYKELMAYWDRLETGRDSHMGIMYNWRPGKKDNYQQAFDGAGIMQAYLNNYSMAA